MSHEFRRPFLAAALLGCAGAHAADGALDASFGTGGKVQLSAAMAGAAGSNFTATDVAVQSSGKIIVAGYTDNTCVLARLNPNGSLDSGFGGTNNFSPGFAGFGNCSFTGIALRADDRIVAVANQTDGVAVVAQFTANGFPDGGFGSGATILIPPASGDSTYASRVVLEKNGTIDVAGFYHQQSTNNNQFLFAQISADGRTVQPLFQYEFGIGNDQDDHAQDLAIDSQGRYVVVGYHRGASGNYDFAAIRIRSDLYDVDNTFGSGGQTTVDFGDNGDYAYAVSLSPNDYITLGGQANGQAAVALLDSSGKLVPEITGYTYDRYQFAFGNGGGNDVITRLIRTGDDENAQLLAIGSGNQSYASGPGGAAGLMFGIARLDFPGYLTFTLDSGFGNNGTEGVYFIARPTGIGNFITGNHGRSAAFANGKLVVVGDTLDNPNNPSTSPTETAIARLAPFDGIFKSGFETPSY